MLNLYTLTWTNSLFSSLFLDLHFCFIPNPWKSLLFIFMLTRPLKISILFRVYSCSLMRGFFWDISSITWLEIGLQYLLSFYVLVFSVLLAHCLPWVWWLPCKLHAILSVTQTQSPRCRMQHPLHRSPLVDTQLCILSPQNSPGVSFCVIPIHGVTHIRFVCGNFQNSKQKHNKKKLKVFILLSNTDSSCRRKDKVRPK